MTADEASQRARCPGPGRDRRFDSTPLYIPTNPFSRGESRSDSRSLSRVPGTKWLMCSPRSSSGKRPRSLPRNETTELLGTSISSRPPGFNIRRNWLSNVNGSFTCSSTFISVTTSAQPVQAVSGFIRKQYRASYASLGLAALSRIDTDAAHVKPRRNAAVVTVKRIVPPTKTNLQRIPRQQNLRFQLGLLSTMYCKASSVQAHRLDLIGEPIMRGRQGGCRCPRVREQAARNAEFLPAMLWTRRV